MVRKYEEIVDQTSNIALSKIMHSDHIKIKVSKIIS